MPLQIKEESAKQDIQDPVRLQMMRAMARFLSEKNEVKDKLKLIKHKIGVYSAKGGVGKTTVSVNIAYALASLGYKVGLIDADIDCPNILLFTGITKKFAQNYPLQPVEHKGVKIISTAMFVDDDKKPIIWRGPIQSKMMKDFLARTEWGELDYMIIDMPPTTGDTPLTLLQILDPDGFLLVTTPQKVASINAIRSGAMVKRLNGSILGVIENMSESGSPQGALEVAKALDSQVLGTLKKNPKFNDFSDKGEVPVLNDEEIKQAFIYIVKKLIK